MEITTEEFDLMVRQLLYDQEPSFDALCSLAEKNLRSSVKRWCYADSCLQGRGYEDDIMQEIQLRLMKNVVTRFLLRDGVSGPVNWDPQGFRSWMFRVASNCTKDFSERIRREDMKGGGTLPEEVQDPNRHDLLTEEQEARVALLHRALDTVLEADVSVYKTLTWLAQFIFMLELPVTKIQSNGMIVDTFSQKTLGQMYDMLLSASVRIPWLVLTQNQQQRITQALQEPWCDGLCYGQATYEQFFMKKGGKKSISDWINRMNNIVRRAAEDGSSND